MTTPENDSGFEGEMPEKPAAEQAPTPEKEQAPNFKQKFQYSSEGLGDKYKLTNETATMPGARASVIREAMDALPQENIAKGEAGKEWLGTITDGLSASPDGAGLEGTALREDASFEQAVQSDIGDLQGFAPAFKMSNGVKPPPNKAMFHIRTVLGMGAVFAIPLWHSGFWVTLKAPTEAALLEMFRQIESEKIRLGRSTYGFIFSNSSVYITRVLMDFIADHVYDTSVELPDNSDLRDLVRLPDLQLLLWGMACAVWPNGFQYDRACVADVEKCRHIVRERLDLSKLLWTDTTALTKRQIHHMTKRQRNSVKPEDVTRYVDEFTRGQARQVKITDELAVNLRVPTVREHIDSGFRWVNMIEQTYAQLLTQDEDRRDSYLITQGRATLMRQYGHFVKSIQVQNIEYDEVEVIEEALSDLTQNDTVREEFMDKVRAYLDDSIVSLVAIPTFTCPACGGHQTGETHHKHPEIIPLDVQQTFFQVLVQRLQKIEAR